MEEDPDVRGGGRAAEDKRITRHPDLADDRTSGAAEPRLTSNQLPPIHDKVGPGIQGLGLNHKPQRGPTRRASIHSRELLRPLVSGQ